MNIFGSRRCVLQLQESGWWVVVVWLDYFSELVALRTSAAHRTGLVGAAGCSCTIYISIMEGGDRQSQAHPLPLPSLISLLFSLSSPSLHLTLFFFSSGKGVFCKLLALSSFFCSPPFSAQSGASPLIPLSICRGLLTLSVVCILSFIYLTLHTYAQCVYLYCKILAWILWI